MVRGWLYAEDGKQFAADWRAPAADLHAVDAVCRLRARDSPAGVVVRHRCAAGELVGIAINVISCLTVGAVAGLVFVFSRDVVTDLACRLVIGMITVLVPIAATEALGNTANRTVSCSI